MELLILSEGKLILLSQVMNNPDEINYYFKNNYQNKIGIFVKLISSLYGMEELKRVQELRVDESSRRRLTKIKTLLMNSRPEFRNYRIKLIV